MRVDIVERTVPVQKIQGEEVETPGHQQPQLHYRLCKVRAIMRTSIEVTIV